METKGTKSTSKIIKWIVAGLIVLTIIFEWEDFKKGFQEGFNRATSQSEK